MDESSANLISRIRDLIDRGQAFVAFDLAQSGLQQNPGDKPAQWLLNVTNDGWFGNTSGPHQHFHHARVRAVEYGLPLVRAANTGISAVIDPYGRVLQKLGVNQTGTLDFALPNRADVTIYSRFSWLISVVILILGIATVARIWQRS